MLLDYRCVECGAFMPDYWHKPSDTPDGKPPEAFNCSECGAVGALQRVRVYVQHVHGPVWTNVDALNQVMFSAKDRRNGKEIKSQRDIQAIEDAKGVYRPDDYFVRVATDEYMHDAEKIKKIAREDGQHAAEEYVDTTEIMRVTEWTKQETETWKARTNAATRQINASHFEPGGNG